VYQLRRIVWRSILSDESASIPTSLRTSSVAFVNSEINSPSRTFWRRAHLRPRPSVVNGSMSDDADLQQLRIRQPQHRCGGLLVPLAGNVDRGVFSIVHMSLSQFSSLPNPSA